MVTLYNVISSDGYIARKNGSEDFIPDDLWPTTLNLFKKFDTLVMGRKTYDVMQRYPRELLDPFENMKLRKIVVTNDRKYFHPNPELGYTVAHSPQDALAAGVNVLVSSGPILNTFLLEKRLVDKIIWHCVPVEIEEGIRPFGTEMKDSLIPISEERLDGGIKKMVYKVLR